MRETKHTERFHGSGAFEIGDMDVTTYWLWKSARVVDDPILLSNLWQHCCKYWELSVKREAIKRHGLLKYPHNTQSLGNFLP